jgi:hypothetical protein
MIRKYLNKFSNKDYDMLLSKLNDDQVKKILFENSRDNPLRLCSKLMFAKPSLIRFIVK